MHPKQLQLVVIFFHGHIFIMDVIVSVHRDGGYQKQNLIPPKKKKHLLLKMPLPIIYDGRQQQGITNTFH